MNKIILSVFVLMVFCGGRSFAKDEEIKKTSQKDCNYIVSQWNMVEISLISKLNYTDPFDQVELFATFTGPGGIKNRSPRLLGWRFYLENSFCTHFNRYLEYVDIMQR